MEKILFIGNDKKYNIKFSLDSLKKIKDYEIVIVNNINNLNKNLKYKFIIIDIEFGNRNGDKICKNLRYNYRKIPIIGISVIYNRSVNQLHVLIL